MGTITKGILGGFSGKVGSVVGGTWKGIDYMRSQSSRRTRAATALQLQQQQKFSVMMKFIQPLAGLLSVSFRNFAVKMTGSNSAFSYNLKNAITGIYPDYAVAYNMALVSRGDLPNANNPSATAGTTGKVEFGWINNAGTGKAADTDLCITVAFCPEVNQAVYSTQGNPRGQQSDSLDAGVFSGKLVETWLGFISADGKEVATSIYTGQVTVL